MKNIYNKSRFRNGEWGKHLRPYLKKIGNRRWRRTAKVFFRNFEDYINNKKTRYRKK